MNYNTIKQLHDQVLAKKSLITELNESIESTNKNILHLNDVLSLLKQSKNYKIESRKSFILDIINRALDEIIHDKNITVDIVSTKSKSSKFNIVYDFVIYKNGREIARNNKVFDTTGGGVISIISFILKIMMGYINTGNKFYIFDESFAQLSEDYLNSLSLFLRNLCEEYGFTLLMVTHNELHESAHLHYKFKSNKDERLIIDKIIKNADDEYLNNDYFSIDIKLFQSIEKIQLNIKGLTVFTGSSDIGKSSIVRAFNSIILNDFKDNYPSDFAKRGNYTKITLEKHKTINDYDSISLEYKQGSVYYYLPDGTEYKGKSLAQDKINKLLADFGFKKIDTSIYKNWKSNLEAQTSRVFVTTQHDSSYFSTEKNATEKLLTLLFNSHMFNDAIVSVESDLREEENKVKEINKTIEFETIEMMRLYISKCKASISMIDDSNKKIIDLSNIIVDYRSKITDVDINITSVSEHINNLNNIQYIHEYEKLLNQYNINKNKFDEINNIVLDLYSIINQYDELYVISINTRKLLDLRSKNISLNIQNDDISNQINISEFILQSYTQIKNIIDYNNLRNQYNVINGKLTKIYDQQNIMSDLIQKMMDYDLNDIDYKIKRYIQLQRQISDNQVNIDLIKNKLNIINKYIMLLSNIISIFTYISNDDNIKKIKNSIVNINNYLKDGINKEFNLKECSICGGIGYVHNH